MKIVHTDVQKLSYFSTDGINFHDPFSNKVTYEP